MSTDAQSTLSLPDLPGIEAGWELLNLDEPETIRRCTGERLEQLRKLRQTVVESSQLGIGVKNIADALKISPAAVRAIRASAWKHAELDPLKERLARKMFGLGDVLVAEAMERIDEIPAHFLLLNGMQAIDKAQLLSGAPTARISHEHTLGVASVADYIDSLPSAAPVVEEKAKEQKALADPDRLAVLDVVEVTPAEPSRDSQSLASAQIPEGKPKVSAEIGQNQAEKGGSS